MKTTKQTTTERLAEACRMAEYCLDFANDEIVTADDNHKALQAARSALAAYEAQPSLEREAIEALRRLVKMYVANAGRVGSEFISCITPNHSSDLTPAERAKDHTWMAWDAARAVLAKAERKHE